MAHLLPGFNPKIHFFVCTNDRGEKAAEKPSCGPLINETMVKELKLWARSEGWTGQVFITRTGCLGGCNPEGGVIAVYPIGRFYKSFRSIEEIKEFILQQKKECAL